MKTLNEKLNNCGKDYKKINTALIIIVEQKLSACFNMFIHIRNTALEMSQSTMKPNIDDFCKGLINEQKNLITSGQVSPNKALTVHNNKNLKKNFNHNVKGSCSHASNHTNNSVILLMLIMKLVNK